MHTHWTRTVVPGPIVSQPRCLEFKRRLQVVEDVRLSNDGEQDLQVRLEGVEAEDDWLLGSRDLEPLCNTTEGQASTCTAQPRYSLRTKQRTHNKPRTRCHDYLHPHRRNWPLALQEPPVEDVGEEEEGRSTWGRALLRLFPVGHTKSPAP